MQGHAFSVRFDLKRESAVQKKDIWKMSLPVFVWKILKEYFHEDYLSTKVRVNSYILRNYKLILKEIRASRTGDHGGQHIK